jgi:hypothetical protein
MPSNNTGFEAGRLFGRFPERMGHLHSVESPREPKPGIVWALDNGAFGAWSNGLEWDERPFYDYLDRQIETIGKLAEGEGDQGFYGMRY